MFDFEYSLSLPDCKALTDPTVSDIIEEHAQMIEEYDNGKSI